jgi:hypothetical protein
MLLLLAEELISTWRLSRMTPLTPKPVAVPAAVTAVRFANLKTPLGPLVNRLSRRDNSWLGCAVSARSATTARPAHIVRRAKPGGLDVSGGVCLPSSERRSNATDLKLVGANE